MSQFIYRLEMLGPSLRNLRVYFSNEMEHYGFEFYAEEAVALRHAEKWNAKAENGRPYYAEVVEIDSKRHAIDLLNEYAGHAALEMDYYREASEKAKEERLREARDDVREDYEDHQF